MERYINRSYDLEKLVQPGQALVVYGPRRSGKTTLLKAYTDTLKEPFLSESGDNTFVKKFSVLEVLKEFSLEWRVSLSMFWMKRKIFQT